MNNFNKLEQLVFDYVVNRKELTNEEHEILIKGISKLIYQASDEYDRLYKEHEDRLIKIEAQLYRNLQER